MGVFRDTESSVSVKDTNKGKFQICVAKGMLLLINW